MSEYHYAKLDTRIGALILASDGDAITSISMRSPNEAIGGRNWSARDAALGTALEQLAAYFAGELREFSLPLAPRGTPFQQGVWAALRRIPFGETISYGDLAARLGRPNAARAVGSANRGNPISIVVPCHRVIGHDGTLTGYAGGLDRKRYLLAHESRCARTASRGALELVTL